MGAILAFLKSVYGHKEKVILGILILAFVGVAFFQLKIKKNGDSDNDADNNPDQLIYDGWKPAPRREPESYKVPALASPYPLETYFRLLGSKAIFGKPRKERAKGKPQRETEWAKIRVKSVFDPTQSGSYIAIIEVDKRSRIVKEGQLFGDYVVERIDGVRNCLSISRREFDEKREFCREE